MEVRWRRIKDNENYLVSNTGLVYSEVLKQYMKLTPSSVGNYGGAYLVVNLGRRNKKYVHRLVAEAFCQHRDGCDYVNHIDENKLNNAAINLEWVTNADNIKHSRAASGKAVSPDGEVFEFSCQNDFVKVHGLNSGCFSLMLSGKQKHHKGWTRYET